MREEVLKALDKVKQMLAYDGGNVELVDITPDGIVRLRLTGACSGCPMSSMTLKMGVERILKQEVPQIKAVEAVQ